MTLIQQEIIFWLLFSFFNATVFSLYYVLNYDHQIWLPFQDISKKTNRGIFVSVRPDIYNLCFDITVLILLFRYFKIESGFVWAAIFYGVIMIFNIYHYSFFKIYQVVPIIANDFKLIKTGLAILWTESPPKVILVALVTFMLIIGLSMGFYEYLQFASKMEHSILFYISLVLFAAFCTASFIRKGVYNINFDLYHRILVMSLRIISNITYSRVLMTRKRDLLNAPAPINLHLKKKPNIFFLFVESYGSILLKDNRLKAQYLDIYNRRISQLNEKGWNAINNFSTSVSLIGPSWLAYTTVLTGVKIPNNFEYEYLLNQTETHSIRAIAKQFQIEGYMSYFLNASKPKNGIEVPYRLMSELYGINKWILAGDLNYTGTIYGAIANPPDEFTLNFAFEEVIDKEKTPFFLYYLTKNSHSPYISPKTTVSDWRELNDGSNRLVGDRFLQQPNFEDYLSSINYQLEMLTNFILRNGKDDDIFVLYGDHQPPALAKIDEHGLETMVHVISKNGQFLEGFSEYGFKQHLSNLDQPINHEGFHSLFTREIMKNYSLGGNLPDYKPEGIKF